MQLNDLLTESELNEINLGRMAGGIARGVGAIAGGAAGTWDAAKKGFKSGRQTVAGDDSEYTSDYNTGFMTSRARASGDTTPVLDHVLELIDQLSPRDRQQVLNKLGHEPGTVARNRGTSSTGGTIEPTDRGVIHRAKAKPAASPLPTASDRVVSGGANPAAKKPAAKTPAKKVAAKTAPTAQTPAKKPAAKKTAAKSGAVNEALRASPEEIQLFRDEIKAVNDVIMRLNKIYNRVKNSEDAEAAAIVKARIANKTKERNILMQQLEQRLTTDAFNTLKEELALPV